MNSVLATPGFWRAYFAIEGEEAAKEDLAAQLDGLREDFSVREEPVKFEFEGREHTVIRRSVEFSFPCGERFSLVIEYVPDADGCELNLFLADARFGTRNQMGWWDSARWHPYCLRADELDSLLHYWERFDLRWEGNAVPLLMFCPFVGLTDSDARQSLAANVQAAVRSLGLPVTGDRSIAVPLHIPDGDYRWEIDDKLGWVFTSDEYCCYSLRNRAHADGAEGRFPFGQFREMLADVQQRLNE